ncbi:MAG: HYR domain-containing protein [Phycisphaerae bacterium]|nr:HYR domain-containing protein [Saprospiraceae bacterium]
MNRALLLLLSVLTINLFGKVLSPERLKTETPVTINTPNIKSGPLLRTQKIHQSNPAYRLAGNREILADTVPPVMDCPSSTTIILLTQGRCDTVLNFSVTATDDQGTAIVIQLSGLTPGSVFPIGVSTCVFLATDLSGNTATCSFAFTVDDGGVTSLNCSDLDTVALDINCVKTLLPQDILEGGPYGCWSRYFTEIDKTIPYGNGPWLPAAFGVADLGKTYQCRVTDSQTGNKCWGDVKILDKTPPVFNCQDLTVSCAEDNLSPSFLKDSLGLTAAMPQVNDACGPLKFLGHIDTNFPFNCDSPFTKIVSRRWQANDESGNISTCIQQIKLHRHTLGEMQLPPNMTLNCPDTNIIPSVTGQPFLMYQGRRYEAENNSICDISAFYEDYPLALPCGDRRIRRLWEFFDFCTGLTEGPFLQNIYILDNSAPHVDCPASLLVTLNADTCYGLVNLPDAVLDDACSQVTTFQAFWEENGLAKTLLGSLADFAGNNPADFDTLGVMGTVLLPVGVTTISYVVEDSCGNIGDCTFNLTVADMVPPIAKCDTFSTLQLLDNGLLAIGASLLDNGSSDACTPVSFKARFLDLSACLYDTAWTDSLRFCCYNQNDTLDVVLRVYDIPVPSVNVSATFGTGHFSDCALKIAITDPNLPTCVAPQNLVVNCEDFDQTLQSYGEITSASCAVDSVSIDVDYTQFDTICHRGTIVRIFNVFDKAGNSGACAQAVQVDYLQDYFIKFPDDMIVTMCDGTGIYGQPSFFGQNCEEFDVDFTDDVFTVVPDACFKIERTWKIKNKCTYDPDLPFSNVPNPNPSSVVNHVTNLPGPIVSACNALPPWSPTIVKINPTDPQPTNYCVFWQNTANGYQYKQIIKIIDAKAPTGTYTVPACANQTWTTANNPQFWNEIYWLDNNLAIHDLCEEPTDLSITATDGCSGANVNIEYLLFLDLDGNGTTETVVNSVTVGIPGIGWNNVLFDNLNTPNYAGGTPRSFDERAVSGNQKMGFAIEETILGKNKTAKLRWNTQQQPDVYFAPELPHGTHKIRWSVTDQCGNNKDYEYAFTVKDCKTPTVVCDNGLSVNIMPTGIITLYASDFLQYKEDNCTPEPQIKIGIRKCGTGTGFPVDGNGNPITNVTHTCTELGARCVELWAIDKAGNADFCQTTLIVQDNGGNCPQSADSITGRIITEQGVGISDVSIKIEGSSTFAPPFSFWYANLTDGLGYYSLPTNQIPLAATFDITPEKDNNPLNGVTTYDLVQISKHIIATEPLTSPYKMIAADANKSGSVTSFDIVELRKLILGLYVELPNNTSWRFIDSSFVFPNPLNPFQTGFPDTIPLGNPTPYNFIGVKVGDVNNTAVPNVVAPTEERFEGTVYFDTEDHTVQEAELFELKFSASERLEGCQFTLETEGLEILEILPGENMSKDNFALFPKKSQLTMSWELGGEASFILKMKAQKAGSLRDMLHINSEITQAEAYVYPKTLPTIYPSYAKASAGKQSTNLTLPTGRQAITKSRLALRFGNSGSTFDLFQNQPNPFAHKTAITFQIPEASPAVLTILDENGKVIWSKSGDWPAGMNSVEIDLSGLSAAGVLYYKLETPAKSAVRKMVRI